MAVWVVTVKSPRQARHRHWVTGRFVLMDRSAEPHLGHSTSSGHLSLVRYASSERSERGGKAGERAVITPQSYQVVGTDRSKSRKGLG